MLVELAVRDLGVIEDLRLLLGPGMTALTGETGAGKTLVVDAIELLVGGRADPALVRAGADEAWVEGRFLTGPAERDGAEEVVLARAIPAQGRSRAYVDGRLATVAALTEWGERLVDLHGQHAHQSLLAAAVQRRALDRYAGVDLGPLHLARERLRSIDAALADLGGDPRARAREVDLLRFQVTELADAALTRPDEDEVLETEEATLADAAGHRGAAEVALQALAGEGRATDALGEALSALDRRAPFTGIDGRLRGVAAELTDIVTELRRLGEGIEEDPARMEAIRLRRQLLHDLRRKYGDSLEEVMAHQSSIAERLVELERHDERAAELDTARSAAAGEVASAAEVVLRARRAAAPGLAAAVEAHLAELAMERARVEVVVEGPGPGDDVAILLAANPGSPALPLAKAASGGELARTMLALRLVLTAGPPCLVFDEVDAGIGGSAALAVGRALAALARERQVLVVTHLPQVAAFADAHVSVTKESDASSTVAHAAPLAGPDRVVELTRMLSGRPDSRSGREHAEELLEAARGSRGGD